MLYLLVLTWSTEHAKGGAFIKGPLLKISVSAARSKAIQYGKEKKRGERREENEQKRRERRERTTKKSQLL